MPFQAKPPLPTGLLFDDVYLQHLSGDTGHPERPERLTAIRDGLEQAGLLKSLFRIEPRRVTERELELVHKPSYIELVRRELSGFEGLKELSTGDTLASPESLQTAEFAWRRLECCGGGDGREGQERFRSRSASRPSRYTGSRHGLLHFQ